MKKLIISIIMVITSMSSFAFDVKYIGVNSANVREYANYDSPIVDKIPKGKFVTVYDTLDGWSRLTDVKETNQRWVHSNDLCNTKGCSVGKVTTNNVKQASKTNQLKSTTTHYKQKSTQVKQKGNKQRAVYSSGCSCGSGNYCYGPRGGRYCITSGGNKSYR
ncbi:SH3 domain-containing protein [[Pasteurella] aerogenes]|nr:SH3 domain-containing protein [[Pasteurella] aerogenes]